GDVEDDAVVRRARGQLDRAARRCELACVLKEIGQRRAEELTIAVHVGCLVDGRDDESYTARPRLRGHTDLGVLDQVGDCDALEGSNACIDANTRKRLIDEIAERVQASLEE